MEPMNREQRRHPEKLEELEEQAAGRLAGDDVPRTTPEEQMPSAGRVPDDLDVRAKSTGHGKKTADKWNQ